MAIAASAAWAVVPGTNGKIFYETGDGPGDIWSANPNGMGATNLTNSPSATEERPSVSGNGQHVVYMTYTDGWSIWKMNANGSNPLQLTLDGPDITNFEPGISPNGNRVVFQKQDTEAQDVYTVGINGGAETDITNTPYDTAPGANDHSDECCAEYSPAGTKIVYVNAYNLQDHEDTYNNDIWVMNADGTNQHALTNTSFPMENDGPSWSPDGTKIVFSRTANVSSAPGYLYVMNANGTNVTPLMNGASQIIGYNPTWSPDGTRIAYNTGSTINIVSAAGGLPQAFPVPGADQDYPSWAVAPDTTAPNTTITSGPSGTIKVRTATFRFSSSEAGSHFQCRMGGAAFAPCASPKSYSGLANGSHTFRVRAIDKAGNVDPTPAARTFSVQP
jgi:Tol biopolymer transport system component